MKIPYKITEEEKKILANGNLVIIPKYGEYQRINDSMLKYHQYEPTVYLYDEEIDKWFVVDELDVPRTYKYELFKNLEIKDLYLNIHYLKEELNKLPKWIKKWYKISSYGQ